jgi:hypothetical protein
VSSGYSSRDETLRSASVRSEWLCDQESGRASDEEACVMPKLWCVCVCVCVAECHMRVFPLSQADDVGETHRLVPTTVLLV